jgi:hypothetical protein
MDWVFISQKMKLYHCNDKLTLEQKTLPGIEYTERLHLRGEVQVSACIQNIRGEAQRWEKCDSYRAPSDSLDINVLSSCLTQKSILCFKNVVLWDVCNVTAEPIASFFRVKTQCATVASYC